MIAHNLGYITQNPRRVKRYANLTRLLVALHEHGRPIERPRESYDKYAKAAAIFVEWPELVELLHTVPELRTTIMDDDLVKIEDPRWQQLCTERRLRELLRDASIDLHWVFRELQYFGGPNITDKDLGVGD